MRMTEIYPAIFAFISAACLASIQIRRIIRGELPLFGLRVFVAASKIRLDRFDKIVVIVASASFILFVVLTLMRT
jgi:hypothetical protein